MRTKQNNFPVLFKTYISQCRPGDWDHAKRVVGWVRELGGGRGDLELLVVAGYLHDVGWMGLVAADIKLSRDELLRLQPMADKQTEELVTKILRELNYADTEILTVLRLIRATETYEAKSDDEMILVDADNLSKTDPDHVRQKYQKADWMMICDLFEEKLPERIKTQKGKWLFPKRLIRLREVLSDELGVGR